uniref:Dimer_Tnp_hAT domain-containing protein n=1 Tax=Rhabditophanes sp. KR3021 TaxID=114890 RepID=A0AC35TMG1_9BILA
MRDSYETTISSEPDAKKFKHEIDVEGGVSANAFQSPLSTLFSNNNLAGNGNEECPEWESLISKIGSSIGNCNSQESLTDGDVQKLDGSGAKSECITSSSPEVDKKGPLNVFPSNQSNPFASMLMAAKGNPMLNQAIANGTPSLFPFPFPGNCSDIQIQQFQNAVGASVDPTMMQMYMKHTNNLFKSFLQTPDNHDSTKQNYLHTHRGNSLTPISTSPPSIGIPGALAVAQTPAAALFPEDDWSWHRNPAAAIRSGGTNKQTPVWKYFVYNKIENLSRCIIGDCAYMLKGPHTSTLACHLKKHPKEFGEFQQLKVDYTKERNASQLGNTMNQQVKGTSQSNGTSNEANTNYQKGSGIFGKTMSLPGNDYSQNMSNKGNNMMHPTSQNIKQSSSSINELLNVLSAKAQAAADQTDGGHNKKMLDTMMMQSSLINSGGFKFDLMNMVPMSQQIQPPQRNGQENEGRKDSIKLHNNENVLKTEECNNFKVTKFNEDKWLKEDKKQKELEVRLAMMLGTTQLPLKIIQNPEFREFLRLAQPKFDIPEDVKDIDLILNNEYFKMLEKMKVVLAKISKFTIMVDVLKISSRSTSSLCGRKRKHEDTQSNLVEEGSRLISNESIGSNSFPTSIQSDVTAASDDSSNQFLNQTMPNLQISPTPISCSSSISPSQGSETQLNQLRLCVSIAFYNTTTGKIEILLLGIRPIEEHSDDIKDCIRSSIQKIIFEHHLDINKALKVMINGLSENGIDDNAIFANQITPHNIKLASILKTALTNSRQVNDLKKAFYQMTTPFMACDANIAEYNKCIENNAFAISKNDSFYQLATSVTSAKKNFLAICLSQSVFSTHTVMMNEGQWMLLEQLIQLINVFKSHLSRIHGSDVMTIDKIVPSLMQLKVTLMKDFEGWEELCLCLVEEIERTHADILDIQCPSFDSTFVEATLMNVQLAVLLDDSQVTQVKGSIEKAVAVKMRNADENTNNVTKKESELNNYENKVFLSATSPALSSASSTSSEMSNATQGNGSSCPYPDLLEAANLRRKQLLQSNKNNENKKNAYAEAIVQTYLNQLFAGDETCADTEIGRLPPNQFWKHYASKSIHLAEYATELLSIPACTLSIPKIFKNDDTSFSLSLINNAFGESTYLPSFYSEMETFAINKALETPRNYERDVLLKFNNLCLCTK